MPKVEDRLLTPKENYLRMLKGEDPEWVPIYTMGAPLPDGEPIPLAWVAPQIINENRPFGGEDVWGVNWVGGVESGGGLLPEPGKILLEDVTKWRDVIHAPDLSDIDFELMVKRELERKKIDRSMTAVGQDVFIGFFQMLVAFMGFEGALLALYEEPEEVKALLDYIADFYIGVLEACFPHYQPDVLLMADDTCAWQAPFMSEEMFREFFVPLYKREARMANEAGIPIEFHNCGKAARFIEICHEEFDLAAWDPAQITNDLVAFKEKHGRSIALVGGWSAQGELLEPDVADEAIYESVRTQVELLAPGGGYAFMGSFLGDMDDPVIRHKNLVLKRSAQEICNCFYD